MLLQTQFTSSSRLVALLPSHIIWRKAQIVLAVALIARGVAELAPHEHGDCDTVACEIEDPGRAVAKHQTHEGLIERFDPFQMCFQRACRQLKALQVLVEPDLPAIFVAA